MGEHYLKRCVTKPESSDGNSEHLVFGASSVQGWRNTQEDAHIALPKFQTNASLFAVFDGHNGVEVAKFAAKYLPQIILKNNNYREGNIELGLKESFITLDQSLLTRRSVAELIRIRQQYSKSPITRSNAPAIASGCTAVVALIKDNVLYVANLGDSRCILSRSNKAFPMSSDHKPEDQSERERIERAGGEVVYGRINCGINVSRAFGDHLYKRNSSLPPKQQMIIAWPHVQTEPLRRKTDQFMVLICDGVWNCISNEDLINFVAKRIKTTKLLSKICEELFAQLLSPVMPTTGIAGKDKMTFLLIKFENATDNKKRISSKESIFVNQNSIYKNSVC